jgi:hypothetical protein
MILCIIFIQIINILNIKYTFFLNQTESQNIAVDRFCIDVRGSHNDMAAVTCLYNKLYV